MSYHNNMEKWQDKIADFTVGLLSTEEAIELQKHLNECPQCKGYLKDLENDDKLLGEFASFMSEERLVSIEENVLAELDNIQEKQKQLKTETIKIETRRWLPRVAAVAAVILIVAALGIMIGRKTGEPSRVVERPVEPTEKVVEQPKVDADKLKKELEQVFEYAKAKDVDGLLDVLENGSMTAKYLAAKILGDMGEVRALPMLIKLDAQTEDPNNPFAEAIEKIKATLEQLEVDQSGADDETTGQTDQAVAPEDIVLSGIITDALTGEPIEDVSIQVKGESYLRTYTDANGYYQFAGISADGNYQLMIYSEGYIGTFVDEAESAINLNRSVRLVKDMELQRGCMIEIDVVNETNEPVKEVFVSLMASGEKFALQLGGSNATDANGAILLGGVLAGELPYKIIARHDEYAIEIVDVNLTDVNVIEYKRVELSKGQPVAGYVEYADGVPLAGGKVYARPVEMPQDHTTTEFEVDANGMFTLENIKEGIYSINVMMPDSNRGLPVGEYELPLEEGMLELSVREKSPVNYVSITGSITKAMNEPIMIEAMRPGETAKSGFVEIGETEFVVEGLTEGIYTLRFKGINIETVVIENVQAPAEGLEVELGKAIVPTISGTVVDEATGEPIKNFKIRPVRDEVLDERNYIIADRWFEFDNPQGRFDVEVISEGVYQIQIQAEGYASDWSEVINTTENIGPIQISLNSGGRITGQILNNFGEPVSAAIIKVFDGLSSDVSVEGAFELRNVAAGIHEITAELPGYETATVTVEVAVGLTTENAVLTLMPIE